eukprot:24639-Eustigmatos_ZCMA.PRE.1
MWSECAHRGTHPCMCVQKHNCTIRCTGEFIRTRFNRGRGVRTAPDPQIARVSAASYLYRIRARFNAYIH